MLGFQGGVSIPLVKGGVKAPPAKRQCRAGPKAGARRGFTPRRQGKNGRSGGSIGTRRCTAAAHSPQKKTSEEVFLFFQPQDKPHRRAARAGKAHACRSIWKPEKSWKTAVRRSWPRGYSSTGRHGNIRGSVASFRLRRFVVWSLPLTHVAKEERD